MHMMNLLTQLFADSIHFPIICDAAKHSTKLLNCQKLKSLLLLEPIDADEMPTKHQERSHRISCNR